MYLVWGLISDGSPVISAIQCALLYPYGTLTKLLPIMTAVRIYLSSRSTHAAVSPSAPETITAVATRPYEKRLERLIQATVNDACLSLTLHSARRRWRRTRRSAHWHSAASGTTRRSRQDMGPVPLICRRHKTWDAQVSVVNVLGYAFIKRLM